MQPPQAEREEVRAAGLPTVALLRYGRRGRPWVYLPTSGGDEREAQRYGLPALFAPWIEAGRLQLFAVDAHGPRTLFDDGKAPRERIASYVAFERALVEHVLPRIAALSGHERLDLIGASYGAFVAMNLLFKRPERVADVAAFGGVYEMWHRLDGHHDDDVYFHTPLEYLPRLTDPAALDAIRAAGRLDLYAARDDEWLEESFALRRVLDERALPYELDLWESPHGHHEATWRQQIGKHLRRRLPL